MKSTRGEPARRKSALCDAARAREIVVIERVHHHFFCTSIVCRNHSFGEIARRVKTRVRPRPPRRRRPAVNARRRAQSSARLGVAHARSLARISALAITFPTAHRHQRCPTARQGRSPGTRSRCPCARTTSTPGSPRPRERRKATRAATDAKASMGDKHRRRARAPGAIAR